MNAQTLKNIVDDYKENTASNINITFEKKTYGTKSLQRTGYVISATDIHKDQFNAKSWQSANIFFQEGKRPSFPEPNYTHNTSLLKDASGEHIHPEAKKAIEEIYDIITQKSN
jgi:hypothetical protein